MMEGDGTEMRRELAHQGLRIGAGKQASELILIYFKIVRNERRARRVDKLGWHGESYLSGSKSYGHNDSDESVVFQSENCLTRDRKSTV